MRKFNKTIKERFDASENSLVFVSAALDMLRKNAKLQNRRLDNTSLLKILENMH